MRKKEKGRRISIWIPEKNFWLFDVLAGMQRKIEINQGVSMSQGEIIRYLLLDRIKEERSYVEQTDISDISEEG